MCIISPLKRKNSQVILSSKPPLSKKIDSVKSMSENGYFYNNRQQNLRVICNTQSSTNSSSSSSQSFSSFAFSQKSFTSQNSVNDLSINNLHNNCNELFQENIFLNYFNAQKTAKKSKRLSVFSSVKSFSELEKCSQQNTELKKLNKLEDKMPQFKLKTMNSERNSFLDKMPSKEYLLDEQINLNQISANDNKNIKQTAILNKQKTSFLSSNQEFEIHPISDRNSSRKIIKIQGNKLNLVLPPQTNQSNKNEMQNNKFILLQKLQDGLEVDTFKAFDCSSLDFCVIKRIKSNKYEIQAIRNDLQNQSYPFNSSNILENQIKFQEIESVNQINTIPTEEHQNQFIYIKSQYFENKSLFDLLQYSKILNETFIYQIFSQVYSQFLSLCNLQIHLRNGISFSNILFDKEFKVFLGHRFSSDSIDEDLKRIKQLSFYYQMNEKIEQIQEVQSDIVLNIGYLILKSIISPNFSIFQSTTSQQKFNIKNFKQNHKQSKNCCIFHDICEVAENQIKGSFIELNKAIEISKFIKNNYSQSMIDLLCGSLRYKTTTRYSLSQIYQYFNHNSKHTFENPQEKIQKLFQAVKVRRIQQQKQALLEQAKTEIQLIKEKISNFNDNQQQLAIKISNKIFYEGIFSQNQVYQLLLLPNQITQS